MEQKATEMTEQQMENSEMGLNADENMAGTTHLNEQVETETELERLKAQLEEEKNKYLYLVAEFDNFRRRTSKERLELMQTAGKEVISSLLEVLDDADRAEAELAKNGKEDEGVKLVFHKLRSLLQGRGLKVMETLGTDFDADKHEAITEIPAPAVEQKGKVLDEIQKGYLLNDKIIRFAKVVVGK
ncbi:MAG: nucleotide exchange factor GrpE [Chitinophagaceae bacterium]|nr:nucleotide exchange factor GrpE [Chitinophagaceae bacterium]